jgi:hypothetical protein
MRTNCHSVPKTKDHSLFASCIFAERLLRKCSPSIVKSNSSSATARLSVATLGNYDLYQLSGQPEVQTMLRSTEYATIKADYDQISRTYFPKSYFFPEGMSFARSDALFPQPALASVVGPEYEAQCRVLCYGSYPSWDNVQNRFLEMRDIL